MAGEATNMALLRGWRLAVDGGAGLGEKKTYSRPCRGMFLLFFHTKHIVNNYIRELCQLGTK
jgi:hypothetical protein